MFLHSLAPPPGEPGPPTLDGDVVINYIGEPSAGDEFSIFQVMPLVKSLRVLITESAALTPGDVALPNEADKKELPPPELSYARVDAVVANLEADFAAAMNAATGVVDDLLNLPDFEAATEPQRETITQSADDTIGRFADFLKALGTYGIQQTSIGSLYIARQQWYRQLKRKVNALVDRWQQKSDEYDALEAAPPATEFDLLRMERLISSSTTTGVTLALVQAKKVMFDAEFSDLKNIADTNYAGVFAMITDIRALNTAPFDTQTVDIADELRQIPLFVCNLKARALSIIEDIQNTRLPAMAAIKASLPALSLTDQATQTEVAAKMILGEQFKMFPRYAMPPSLEAEVANSWNDTASLLTHVSSTRVNPLEDWLNGIARVHEKMKHLENCLILRDAFQLNDDNFAIRPVQLPYKTTKYHWMAMPFPVADVDMEEGNTLLYTAFTNAAAGAPTEICGVLADEWTEAIPAMEETTGIAFHYDRPNCEAPQTLLLVTPTTFNGNWDWDDLVDALHYTLDAAKSRGISPREIDATPFATFLPAVIGAESLHPLSIVLDHAAHYMAIDMAIDQP
jgi:hypothetical protein